MPPDLRNRIARLEFAPAQGIAGAFLLDERWRRRTVGLVGAAARRGRSAAARPSSTSSTARCGRSPRCAQARSAELLQQPLSLLVMADTGHIEPEERAKLEAWIESGGVLLRFAGPKLAATGDDLVPVPACAPATGCWAARCPGPSPCALAPFPPDSPFAGLPVSR